MARALQTVMPVTRLVSDRALAFVIRPFVAAGWTLTDLTTALEWTPTGRRHPHTSLTHGIDVRLIDRVVRHRLTAWLTGPPPVHRTLAVDEYGTERWHTRDAWWHATPTASPTTRRQAELTHHAARIRAQRERANQARKAGATAPSPVAAAAITQARTAIETARRTRTLTAPR